MTKPHYWQDAIAYLTQQDNVLAQLINRFPDLVLASRGNAFETLLRAIVGQQISVKAADSVWQKLLQAVPVLDYDKVLNTDKALLRSCGLSQQKVNYVLNIATYFADNNINSEHYWHHKPYVEISSELIAIKGVGSWTIEMFAMFYLLEADIFPLKDLGVIRAINVAYNQQNTTALDLDKVKTISDKWRPYRTVATWYLWRSIDAEAINY